MGLKVKDSGRKMRREILFLIAVLALAAFACGGGSSEPPRRTNTPRPPTNQNQSGEPAGEPSEPEPDDDNRPIDPGDLADHGSAPDTPNLPVRCEGQPRIAVCSYKGNSNSHLVPLTAPSKVPLGSQVVVGGCNFPEGETVSISITPPGARGLDTTAVASQLAHWDLSWWLTPNMPLGAYSVEVRSPSGNLEKTFEVVEASEPLLTIGKVPGRREGAYVLTGFQPNEKVLVARYAVSQSSPETTLSGHEVVQVGPDGNSSGTVAAPLPEGDAIIVALGQEASQGYAGMAVSAYDYYNAQRLESDSRLVCIPVGPNIGGPALPTISSSQEVAPSN